MHIKREDFEKQLKQIEDITALSHIELGEEPEIGEISMPMSTIRKILKGCPSADVVEVVRCSQCKHFRDEDVGVGIYTWCELWERETDWDWFCKSGERCSNE